MSPLTQIAQTLDDLARYQGKAELIGGRIVPQMPSGLRHGRLSLQIARSLDDYARATGKGVGLGDNVGYTVPLLSSGRESFSPDAAWYSGSLPDDDRDFIEGSPTFAVEIRSKGDYGRAAENELAAKRADYFEAGTQVVWDVDSDAQLLRSYRATDPERPLIFKGEDIAHAEPAVPGWTLALSDLFGLA